MPIVDNDMWQQLVKINDDPYGKCCVDVAREVMRILDDGEDFEPHDLIIEAEHNIGEAGITGYMAGAIASMVSSIHSRGEEFKTKWNKGYSDEPREGVINPAIITINI